MLTGVGPQEMRLFTPLWTGPIGASEASQASESRSQRMKELEEERYYLGVMGCKGKLLVLISSLVFRVLVIQEILSSI